MKTKNNSSNEKIEIIIPDYYGKIWKWLCFIPTALVNQMKVEYKEAKYFGIVISIIFFPLTIFYILLSAYRRANIVSYSGETSSSASYTCLESEIWL